MCKEQRIIEEATLLKEGLPKLLAHVTVVTDPRAQNVSHKLVDILVIALCAVICGANTCTEMAQDAQGKADNLKRCLELKQGVPSHDTFRRVFRVLDAEAWQGVLFAWTRSLVLEQTGSPTEVRIYKGSAWL